MRVALAAKAAYPFHRFGGVQKYVYSLAKFLVNEGAEVEIVTSLTSDRSLREATHDGIRYRFLPPEMEDKIEKPVGWLWMHCWSYALGQYLSRSDFDIVHGFELAPFYYLTTAGKKKPVVCQLFLDSHRVRSTTRVQLKSYLAPSAALKHRSIFALKLLPIKFCINASDLVATEGEFQDEELVADFGVSPAKLFDIRIGVDLDFIRLQQGRELSVTREKLGLSQDDVVAITVNRLQEEKGLSTLIDSIPHILREFNHFKVLMVGKGSLEHSLLTQAEALGIRDHLVHVREATEGELYDLYRVSDLYVSPTLQDDYIMGIQEAMACGLPIVSTGQRWFVHEGQNGFVVPKKDSRAMAGAVLKFCQDPALRRRHADRSLELIQPFDWKQIAQQTMRQYEGLIGRSERLL